MSVRRIDRLPINDDGNGWNHILAKRVPRKALCGTHNFDWLVIGAGYAGLAAARRLAENQPEASVALVEFRVGDTNYRSRNALEAIGAQRVDQDEQDVQVFALGEPLEVGDVLRGVHLGGVALDGSSAREIVDMARHRCPINVALGVQEVISPDTKEVRQTCLHIGI